MQAKPVGPSKGLLFQVDSSTTATATPSARNNLIDIPFAHDDRVASSASTGPEEPSKDIQFGDDISFQMEDMDNWGLPSSLPAPESPEQESEASLLEKRKEMPPPSPRIQPPRKKQVRNTNNIMGHGYAPAIPASGETTAIDTEKVVVSSSTPLVTGSLSERYAFEQQRQENMQRTEMEDVAVIEPMMEPASPSASPASPPPSTTNSAVSTATNNTNTNHTVSPAMNKQPEGAGAAPVAAAAAAAAPATVAATVSLAPENSKEEEEVRRVAAAITAHKTNGSLLAQEYQKLIMERITETHENCAQLEKDRLTALELQVRLSRLRNDLHMLSRPDSRQNISSIAKQVERLIENHKVSVAV